MTPMISKRHSHGSIVFQRQLWAVGGLNGGHNSYRFLASVEQYSFVKGFNAQKLMTLALNQVLLSRIEF